MKAILLASLFMSLSVSVQARSILVFKTVTKCETLTKVEGNEMAIDVQEAQDGQSQLVMHLSTQEEPVRVQTKKILPPPMSAGTPLQYVGKDPESGAKVTLAISARPVKVGKVTGRLSKLTVKNLFDLDLICSSVKK